MRQGIGKTTMSGGKTDHAPDKVSETAASQIGEAVAYRAPTLYEGKGVMAPKAESTIHHGGSQGRHK